MASSIAVPLIIGGKKIGLIERIAIDDSGDFPVIGFTGVTFHKLEKPEILIKLLEKEGIWLGKP